MYGDNSRGVQRAPFIMYVSDDNWTGDPNYGAIMNEIAQ